MPFKYRCALLVCCAALCSSVHAQTARWPERPVRVVVPFAPGGGTDLVARIIAPRLSEEFGQQFVIDNRAGAAGTLGTEIVVRATPDGHTLLVGSSSFAANAALYKLPYDPLKSTSPVTLITRGPFIVAVHPSLQATNVRELIALARARPGAIRFGSSGVGSVPHLATEMFGQMTRTSIVHVPYKGDVPAIMDLLANRIQLYLGGPLVLSPYISAHRLRALAVTSQHRSAAMPDLPAVSEVVHGYSAFTWFGMWAPAGTPKAIVAQLNRAVARVLRRPDVQDRLRADGMEPVADTPEEFSRYIAQDLAKWTKVVAVGDIRLE
jgi:tripartite-type tricarboxylate transporter receptor subunit TctC